jgi:two-component system KDP operon response regulator KdpE
MASRPDPVASDAAAAPADRFAASGPRILIVDDEEQLRRALRRALAGHGYSVREAGDGASALREFEAFRPDVVLLDLLLPDLPGIEVCRRLREAFDTPIIVLSVAGDEATKIAALDEGADDYLTKPFAAGELLARVRVALRRGSTLRGQRSLITAGDLRIDLERREVTRAGRAVHLTPTEYSLLKYLATNAGRVLTHPMILRAVWGAEYSADTHVLRTYINQLRRKLGDGPGARRIETDPGIGYRFSTADDG